MGSVLSSQRCSAEARVSPGTKGMRVLSSWRGLTGAFSCSPRLRGASKALFLPFELLFKQASALKAKSRAKLLHFIQFPLSLDAEPSIGPRLAQGIRANKRSCWPPCLVVYGQQMLPSERKKQQTSIQRKKIFLLPFFCLLTKRTVTPEVSQPFFLGLWPQIPCLELPLNPKA